MRFLPRRIRLGDHRSRLAEQKAEVPEQALPLTHTELDPLSLLDPDGQCLPIPQIGFIPIRRANHILIRRLSRPPNAGPLKRQARPDRDRTILGRLLRSPHLGAPFPPAGRDISGRQAHHILARRCSDSLIQQRMHGWAAFPLQTSPLPLPRQPLTTGELVQLRDPRQRNQHFRAVALGSLPPFPGTRPRWPRQLLDQHLPVQPRSLTGFILVALQMFFPQRRRVPFASVHVHLPRPSEPPICPGPPHAFGHCFMWRNELHLGDTIDDSIRYLFALSRL